MASQTVNSAVIVVSEQIANSIGGTLVSNTTQVSNLTANGTAIRITMGGQELPIQYGSETILPGLLVNIYIGPNGNAQDQLVLSVPIAPSIANAGAFCVDGFVTLRANGKGGGGTSGNGNTVWAGVITDPSTVIAFPTSNGAANIGYISGNTLNVTVFVQPQSPVTNTNTSISSLWITSANGSGGAVV